MGIETNTGAAAKHAHPRFSLAKVSRGRKEHAVWVHVYGPEGVGKSSFGASAPDPIVIDVEQGTDDIETTRFLFDEKGRTMPADFDELLEAIRTVERDPGPYRTLVVDTLDAVEALIWAYICDRDGQPNVAAYGYGKGENIVALNEWRRLVAALERVRARGVNVVTLSHSIVKHWDDPAKDGGWDRYTLKLHDKAAGLVKERSNAVLFANFDVVLRKKEDGQRKRKAVTTDARWLFTRRTGGYDAKNRNNLPDELPLDWGELAEAMRTNAPASPETLIATIKEKAMKLPEEHRLRVLSPEGYLEDAGQDPVKLAKLNTWVNAKRAEAGVEDEP